LRRIVVVLVMLALVYPAYRYGPPAWRQGRFLYRQHRCLAYEAPADQLVAEEAYATTTGRLGEPGFVALTSPGSFGGAAAPAVGRRAQPLVDLAPHLPAGTPVTIVVGGSSDWMGDGSRELSPTGAPVLFLHELRNRSGQRRLAVVQRTPRNSGPFVYPFGLQVALFEPATFGSPMRYVSRRPPASPLARMSGLMPLIEVRPLRFYAGQPDPHDSAHFTIRYELDGKAGAIDGRLNDAGDDLILHVASGPATAPSFWTTLATQP
jgi:hypothetical protein